jgi:hypothetical protein
MNAVAPQKTGGSAGYAVARAQGKCQICSKDIAPGNKLMAALRETPVALERVDVCLDCWQAFDRTGLLGFWQTIVPQPSAKRPMFVDDDVLCELFERLADAQEPAKINFRFVLGLILMRKRRIVYESSRVEQDREIWTVRLKGREDRLEMVNPKLDDQQAAEVSGQLSQILSADL